MADIKPIYMILHYLILKTCITIAAIKFRFYIFSTLEIINCKMNQYEKNYLNLIKKQKTN